MLTWHIRAFAMRVQEARASQDSWVERALSFIRALVPWTLVDLARFGSLTIGWGLSDSDLDVAVLIPPRAPLTGNALLEHLLRSLRAATAGMDDRVSKILDARGGLFTKLPRNPSLYVGYLISPACFSCLGFSFFRCLVVLIFRKEHHRIPVRGPDHRLDLGLAWQA